jgi:UDP-3-O-[3-hydroxymyristoyl] glucosamine N-acyltransferase
MKLVEVAEKLSCQLEGDGSTDIYGVATLKDAQEGQISFLTNIKYQTELKSTKASAIIVGNDFPATDRALLRHNNPYLTFAKALELFYSPTAKPAEIHPTALISSTASIGKGVSIGAYTWIADNVQIADNVVIESHCTILADTIIGENSAIHSGCVIRQGTIIGRRCIVQSNTVIGSDGFGYAKTDENHWYKILQTGIVVLEDEVEVGAGCTIDRATLGETRLAKGTKLDNMVQIGHGSIIGQDTLLCAQVGLAGSSTIGNQVILAGQVGVAGHLTIGDQVIATAQTGIPNSVEPGAYISGSPAVPHKTWLKLSAIFERLPDVIRNVRNLERRVESLEKTPQVKS